jgi:hypothetical protein
MPPPTRRTGSMGARGTGRGDEEYHQGPRPLFCLPQVDKKCQELKFSVPAKRDLNGTVRFWRTGNALALLNRVTFGRLKLPVRRRRTGIFEM